MRKFIITLVVAVTLSLSAFSLRAQVFPAESDFCCVSGCEITGCDTICGPGGASSCYEVIIYHCSAGGGGTIRIDQT